LIRKEHYKGFILRLGFRSPFQVFRVRHIWNQKIVYPIRFQFPIYRPY
jgi:hypothetical protein